MLARQRARKERHTMTAQLSLEVNRFTSTADSLPQRPGSRAGLNFAYVGKLSPTHTTAKSHPSSSSPTRFQLSLRGDKVTYAHHREVASIKLIAGRFEMSYRYDSLSSQFDLSSRKDTLSFRHHKETASIKLIAGRFEICNRLQGLSRKLDASASPVRHARRHTR